MYRFGSFGQLLARMSNSFKDSYKKIKIKN